MDEIRKGMAKHSARKEDLCHISSVMIFAGYYLKSDTCEFLRQGICKDPGQPQTGPLFPGYPSGQVRRTFPTQPSQEIIFRLSQKNKIYKA
jgi:hypothetical protein